MSFSQRTINGVRYIRDNTTGQEMPESQFKSYYSGIYGQQQKQAEQAQQGQMAGQAGGLAGLVGGKYLAGKVLGSGASSTGTGGATANTLFGNSIFGGGSGVAPTATATSTGTGASGLGLAGVAPYAGVAGGLLLGAKGAKDLFQGKETKGLEGWGGRATLGIATGGLSELARLSGLFGSKTKVEDARYNKLRKAGIKGYENPFQEAKKVNGFYGFDAGQAKDFVGFDKSGKWINNKFAQSRNVNDLKGQDTVGYASWGELLGNDYGNLSNDQKVKLNQQALDNKLITEGKGTINFTDKERVKQLAQALMQKKR